MLILPLPVALCALGLKVHHAGPRLSAGLELAGELADNVPLPGNVRARQRFGKGSFDGVTIARNTH